MKAAFERRVAYAWLTSERARRAIVDLAATLAPHGGSILAMKGVHLAYCVAETPDIRPMRDADALPVGVTLERAVEIARAAGWSLRFENWSSKGLSRGDSTTVDLHRAPLPPLFGGMRLDRLLGRAKPAPQIGAHVLVPDPIDAVVLALAHWVKDSFGATDDERVEIDLDLLLRVTPVSPRDLARRFVEHRLRRVGLLGFHALAARRPRFAPFVEAFAPSRLERAWADGLVHLVGAVARRHHYASFVLVRSAQDTLPHAFLGVAFGLARGVRDELRRFLGNPNHATGWVRSPRSASSSEG